MYFIFFRVYITHEKLNDVWQCLILLIIKDNGIKKCIFFFIPNMKSMSSPGTEAIRTQIFNKRNQFYMNSYANNERYAKTGFLHICENKDTDQLRDNREADQRLCFRYTDSTLPLLPIFEISSL